MNLSFPDSGSKVNGLGNRFTLDGFTVTYSTFQMAWEVVEKRDGYEVAYIWFSSRKKAEAFCHKKNSNYRSLR
jgi:hypothetical protein